MIGLAIGYAVGAVLYSVGLFALMGFGSAITIGEISRSQIAIGVIATLFWPVTLVIQICILCWVLWRTSAWGGWR